MEEEKEVKEHPIFNLVVRTIAFFVFLFAAIGALALAGWIMGMITFK